jgi:hypothetical protein
MGRTEAAIAARAASGFDGILVWVKPETDSGRCVTHLGVRFSIPAL